MEKSLNFVSLKKWEPSIFCEQFIFHIAGEKKFRASHE